MADFLTPQEAAFLARLKTVLPVNPSAAPAEQDFIKNLVSLIESKLKQEGAATTTDVFAMIQAQVDNSKTQINDLEIQNKKAFNDAKARLEATHSTQAVEFDEKQRAMAISAAMTTVLTPNKLEEIAGLAGQTKLPRGDGELTVDITHSASFYTQATPVNYSVTVAGSSRGLVTTEARSENRKHPQKITHRFVLDKNITEAGEDYTPLKFTVRGDLAKNGVQENDTLTQIAQAWLEKNNQDGTKLPAVPDEIAHIKVKKGKTGEKDYDINDNLQLSPGASLANRQKLVAWIMAVNELHTAHGKTCITPIDFPYIYPGLQLALPEGKNIAPKQVSLLCSLDEFAVQGTPENLMAGEAIRLPNLQRMEYIEPKTAVEFGRQNASSTNPLRYVPGSQDAAELAFALTGLDEPFTTNYFDIHNITSRHSVTGETKSGEGDNGQKNNRPHGGRYKQNDDLKKHDKDHRSFLGRLFNGDRGHDYMAGYVPTRDEDNAFVRDEKYHVAFAYGGSNYATKRIVTIPLPFGAGVLLGRPNHEAPINSFTLDTGGTMGAVSLSALGKKGWNTTFRDEQTQNTVPLETQERVYSYMYLKNAVKNLEESIAIVQSPTATQEEKQKAAETAMVAARDYRRNMFIRRVDSMQASIDQRFDAMKQMFVYNKVDMTELTDEKINDLEAHPRLAVRTMDEDQLKKMRNFHKGDNSLFGGRFAGIKPGEFDPAVNAPIGLDYAYPMMTFAEQVMASGKLADPKREEVLKASEQMWDRMLYKPAADAGAATTTDAAKKDEDTPASTAGREINGETIAVWGGIVKTNRNAQITWLEALHDMEYNPQNYFTADEMRHNVHKKLLAQLIPQDKEAAKDVTNHNRTALLPFVSDGPFSNRKPEETGPLYGQAIIDHPAAFAEAGHRMSSLDYGNDSKGRSDGRRFAAGMIRNLGVERVKDGTVKEDGYLPPSFIAVSQSLNGNQPDSEKNDKQLGDVTIQTVTAHEMRAADRSVQAVQLVDNKFKAEQSAQDHTAAETAANVYSTIAERKVLVEGLQRHQLLARDAVLVAIATNPDAFKGMEKIMHQNGHTNYGDLRELLKQTREYYADYQDTQNPKYLDKMVQNYGEFHTLMESKKQRRTNERRQKSEFNFLEAISKDDVATKALTDVILNTPVMRNAALRDTPEFIAETDGTRKTDFSAAQGKHQDKVIASSGDHSYSDVPYESPFFTLPTDENGDVKLHKGFLNLGKRDVIVTPQQSYAFSEAISLNGGRQAREVDATGALVATAKTKQKKKTNNTDQDDTAVTLVPKLDVNGQPMLENGKPLMARAPTRIAQLDGAGKTLRGADGKPIMVATTALIPLVNNEGKTQLNADGSMVMVPTAAAGADGFTPTLNPPPGLAKPKLNGGWGNQLNTLALAQAAAVANQATAAGVTLSQTNGSATPNQTDATGTNVPLTGTATPQTGNANFAGVGQVPTNANLANVWTANGSSVNLTDISSGHAEMGTSKIIIPTPEQAAALNGALLTHNPDAIQAAQTSIVMGFIAQNSPNGQLPTMPLGPNGVPLTEGEVATGLLSSGMAQITQTGQLVNGVPSTSLVTTFGTPLTEGSGLALWWLGLPFIHSTTIHTTEITIPCPSCNPTQPLTGGGGGPDVGGLSGGR